MRASEDAAHTAILRYVGRGGATFSDAPHYFEAYMVAIKAIGAARDPAHSTLFKRRAFPVKLSAFIPRYEVTQRESAARGVERQNCLRLRWRLTRQYQYDVDAEEADRMALSLEILRRIP